MAKKKAGKSAVPTKRSFMAHDLVRKPGSEEDSLHNKCDFCGYVVFWRLLTLSPKRGKEVAYACDWCMAERGWERIAGSRPLVTDVGSTKKKGGKR